MPDTSTTPALETNPFMALEALPFEHAPEAARRIAIAFCFAESRWELGKVLGYGDRMTYRLSCYGVEGPTVCWLDGRVFEPYGGLDGLDDAGTFDALQGMAWDYLDALDAREASARAAAVAAGKVG